MWLWLVNTDKNYIIPLNFILLKFIKLIFYFEIQLIIFLPYKSWKIRREMCVCATICCQRHWHSLFFAYRESSDLLKYLNLAFLYRTANFYHVSRTTTRMLSFDIFHHTKSIYLRFSIVENNVPLCVFFVVLQIYIYIYMCCVVQWSRAKSLNNQSHQINISHGATLYHLRETNWKLTQWHAIDLSTTCNMAVKMTLFYRLD